MKENITVSQIIERIKSTETSPKDKIGWWGFVTSSDEKAGAKNLFKVHAACKDELVQAALEAGKDKTFDRGTDFTETYQLLVG